jgi:hypothetical protein
VVKCGKEAAIESDTGDVIRSEKVEEGRSNFVDGRSDQAERRLSRQKRGLFRIRTCISVARARNHCGKASEGCAPPYISKKKNVDKERLNTSDDSERIWSNSQTSLHTRRARRRDTRIPLRMQQPHTRNRLQRPSISIILKRQTMSHLTTPRYPPQILHSRKKRAISLLPTIFPQLIQRFLNSCLESAPFHQGRYKHGAELTLRLLEHAVDEHLHAWVVLNEAVVFERR